MTPVDSRMLSEVAEANLVRPHSFCVLYAFFFSNTGFVSLDSEFSRLNLHLEGISESRLSWLMEDCFNKIALCSLMIHF